MEPLNAPFNLVAFRGSVTNGTAFLSVAAVQDNTVTRSTGGNLVWPRGLNYVFAGVSGGVNALAARINTPVVRNVGQPYVAPLQTGIVAQSPPNIAIYGNTGIAPNPNDEVIMEQVHTDAAPQIQFTGLWLMGNRREPRSGRKHRIRFTSTVAGVVGAWASGAITLDQGLPAGRYEVQGMDVFGTNLLLARLIFTGGGWRPGVFARNAVASVPSPLFTDGSLGVFGEFDNVNLPQLETFVEAANTAQTGWLDVVKI